MQDKPDWIEFADGQIAGRVRALETGMDSIQQDIVHARLKEGLVARGDLWADMAALQYEAIPYYASFIVATDRETLIGIELPPVRATPAQLAEGFERFIALKNSEISAWRYALEAANVPGNLRRYLPPELLTPQERDLYAGERQAERDRITADLTQFIKGKKLNLEAIEESLTDWGLMAHYTPEVASAFKTWYRSDQRVLPFAGGWLDQPSWVRRDFSVLALLAVWIEFPEDPEADDPDERAAEAREQEAEPIAVVAEIE